MTGIQAEKELIADVISGDQAATEALINQYQCKLTGLALKILANHDDAQDVVQDVLYKVFVKKKINAFRGESQLGSWLYRITVNECKTLMVKKVRHQEKTQEYFCTSHEEKAQTFQSPEAVYLKTLIKEQVKQAVGELDDKYQQGLHEIYYAEKTYKETSEKLNLPMHTLGVRIMRGKQMLAQRLESLKWQYERNGFDWLFEVRTA